MTVTIRILTWAGVIGVAAVAIAFAVGAVFGP
jgi:NhaP-type Na+/H+ or K+/H+ antiporter